VHFERSKQSTTVRAILQGDLSRQEEAGVLGLLGVEGGVEGGVSGGVVGGVLGGVVGGGGLSSAPLSFGWKLRGPLKPADVRRRIEARVNQLVKCRRSPASAKVPTAYIELKILGDGSVALARANGVSSRVRRCLRRELRRVSFPRANNVTRVTFSFRLRTTP